MIRCALTLSSARDVLIVNRVTDTYMILQASFILWCYVQERSKFFKEMRLMMRMRHHSIVRCFGGAQAQQEGDRDVMVLEYIPGGTLDHYVHEHRRDNRLSLNEVLVIATDLADVLRYLHRNGIVHQDLKPSNILLNEKGEVKLTDFGISKIKRSTYLSRFMVGTPSYTAPEVWRADAVWFNTLLHVTASVLRASELLYTCSLLHDVITYTNQAGRGDVSVGDIDSWQYNT